MGACSDLVPDQSKWTHEEKVKKAKEAKTKPKDYQRFFDILVEPFNKLAKDLGIVDVVFLLAHAAKESGWLDEENNWLHNPLGLTAGGKDNLGFDSIQQAVDYWRCLYGDKVRNAKSLKDYVTALKGYNTADPKYYDEKGWAGQVKSVEIRIGTYGYERATDGMVRVLRKKDGK
jgi:hypothetical protein